MKGLSKPFMWKAAGCIKQGIQKSPMGLGNGLIGGRGEWPLWKNGVTNEARKVF